MIVDHRSFAPLADSDLACISHKQEQAGGSRYSKFVGVDFEHALHSPEAHVISVLYSRGTSESFERSIAICLC